MSRLGQGLTANQNSIPRELVYDVDEMLADRPRFRFLSPSSVCDVPRRSSGAKRRGNDTWLHFSQVEERFPQARSCLEFNADHQPIGGKFDVREDQLVTGCLFASYITFDISPELALTEVSRKSC